MTGKKSYKSYVSEIVKNIECCIEIVKSIDVVYKEERKKLRKKLKKYPNLKSVYETKLKEIKEQYRLKIEEAMKETERLLNWLKRSFDIHRQYISDKDILLENDSSMELMESSSKNICLDAKADAKVFEERSEASDGARKKRKTNEECSKNTF